MVHVLFVPPWPTAAAASSSARLGGRAAACSLVAAVTLPQTLSNMSDEEQQSRALNQARPGRREAWWHPHSSRGRPSCRSCSSWVAGRTGGPR
jgi:hypothetical protein